jgi:hypothetical protein
VIRLRTRFCVVEYRNGGRDRFEPQYVAREGSAAGDDGGGSVVIGPGGEDAHRGWVEAERFDADVLEAGFCELGGKSVGGHR